MQINPVAIGVSNRLPHCSDNPKAIFFPIFLPRTTNRNEQHTYQNKKVACLHFNDPE